MNGRSDPSRGELRAAWVVLNGERRPAPATGLLTDLLATVGVTSDTPAVAIALNGRVVPRAGWAASRVAQGDVIDVLRPIQGGT